MKLALWAIFWICVYGFFSSLSPECDRQKRGFKCDHDTTKYNCSIAIERREKDES